MDELGLPHAWVGGVSMGGYIAMALARKAPARLRGLVLIDTQASPDDAAGKARRAQAADDVMAHGAGVVADAMLPRLFAPPTPAATRQQLDEIMRRQPPRAIAAAARGMALRPDSLPGLAMLAVPTLIVVGEHDELTPVAKARAMQEAMPHASLQIINNAGHLPHLEAPQAFAEVVTSFIARH